MLKYSKTICHFSTISIYADLPYIRLVRSPFKKNMKIIINLFPFVGNPLTYLFGTITIHWKPSYIIIWYCNSNSKFYLQYMLMEKLWKIIKVEILLNLNWTVNFSGTQKIK